MVIPKEPEPRHKDDLARTISPGGVGKAGIRWEVSRKREPEPPTIYPTEESHDLPVGLSDWQGLEKSPSLAGRS